MKMNHHRNYRLLSLSMSTLNDKAWWKMLKIIVRLDPTKPKQCYAKFKESQHFLGHS